MSGLEKKLPPLALLLLFALLLQLTSYYLPSSNLHPTFSLGLAVSLLTAGLVIPLAGVLSFKRHGTTPDPRVPEQSSALVTSGIYRCSRNPMYLGFVLLLLAQAVFLNSLWLNYLYPSAYSFKVNKYFHCSMKVSMHRIFTLTNKCPEVSHKEYESYSSPTRTSFEISYFFSV